MHPRIKLKNVCRNAKISSTQQGKTDSVQHPIKGDHCCKDTGGDETLYAENKSMKTSLKQTQMLKLADEDMETVNTIIVKESKYYHVCSVTTQD